MIEYKELKQILQDEHVDTIEPQTIGMPIHRDQHIVSESAHNLAIKIIEYYKR